MFDCDFPGCTRSFVRQDVYARHRERHADQGSKQRHATHSLLSNPQSKLSENVNPSLCRPTSPPPEDAESPIVINMHQKSVVPAPLSLANHENDMSRNSYPYFLQEMDQNPSAIADGDVRGVQFRSTTHALRQTSKGRSKDDQNLESVQADYQRDDYATMPILSHTRDERQYGPAAADVKSQESIANREFFRPTLQQEPSTQLDLSTSVASPELPTIDPTLESSYMTMPAPRSGYAMGHDLPPSTPPQFSSLRTTGEGGLQFTNSGVQDLNSASYRSAGVANSPTSDLLSQDNINAEYSMSQLQDQGANTSPAIVTDDFTAWLFNEQKNSYNKIIPPNRQTAIGTAQYFDDFGGQVSSNYFADPALDNIYPYRAMQQQSPVALNPMLDPSPNSFLLSQGKRRRLIELLKHRFNEVEHSAVRNQKDAILGGDHDNDDHLLSMNSMRLYVGSYWQHFHAQLPILHKPTFSADSIHDYLLLAVMAIGASCLEDRHAITDMAAQLSDFVAWHLRWQIFADADFQPPARLWVFQTLLLLEAYEKMKGTRTLHERAHIHFGTTLTLMRRGSFLIGESRLDSPPASARARTSDPTSRQPAAEAASMTPAQWWNHWIIAEATRRAAFAAFVLDSTHATMFGHVANMVVHEVRLPLPCDEALWSATSAAEVGRVEASLHASGIKPVTFLDGLKRTLSGRKVRTNSFGRIILMAGLLSVSWHMHQMDRQSSSLDVHALGVPDGWRDSLTQSFDFWKRDFDESLEHMRSADLGWQIFGAGILDGENVSEASATVLHHLSHMATNADILDCQIFAGTTKLLGRPVTDVSYKRVRGKMAVWVKSAKARDAVFHAIEFIKWVLVPEGFGREDLHDSDYDRISGCLYSARDDPLFNRPRVLYFAALVVWSYGFALDGPLRPFSINLTLDPPWTDTAPHGNLSASRKAVFAQAVFRDAKSFMVGPMGTLRSPEALDHVTGGRNRVAGLLGLVEMAFEGARWELLHEAAERLKWAVDMLRPD